MSKKINYYIPNFVTTLNLLAGCIAILHATRGQLNTAAFFILAAAALDFLDGFLARILISYSEFGKQLDSLADIVSFGVAPSAIMYHLLIRGLTDYSPTAQFDPFAPTGVEMVILYSSFLIAIFSALRLARFNLDSEQKISFKGLPTPASALFIASVAFVSDNTAIYFIQQLSLNLYALLGIIVVICFLLVTSLPMFSLKFVSFNFKDNAVRYIYLIVSAILIIVLGSLGFNLAILFYIALSVIYNWLLKYEA
ncbi:MAG: CDP-diacylglycerol--serine O-phosphatidyltransferase [Bacteroidetes bacterium]|jgi:CDP-diacylglycerol--serine O-phosphatidyltransferase|nr:CDP-diacylglycerol--serine O-phosphatidyltransferase [Bacteroidota bacterium]